MSHVGTNVALSVTLFGMTCRLIRGYSTPKNQSGRFSNFPNKWDGCRAIAVIAFAGRACRP